MAQGRFLTRRAGNLAVVGGICLLLSGTAAHAQDDDCTGDCNDDNMVAINELIIGVNIALDLRPVADCPSFACTGGTTVPINCLIQAVNNALEGCVPITPCPLAAGEYSIVSGAGGTLRVASLSTFPFPPGGTVVMELAQGNADCVHEVVVKFPGGFSSPTFCIPTLGFSVQVVQTSCGVGQLDSNGGSDYTVAEVGDTSDASEVCDLPQACTSGQDSSVRVDVTVGDDTADACASGGTANSIVAIPVHTLTWLENADPGECPAQDGTYDPENGDTLISEFDQILDFTTDAATAKFEDLDGNGCAIAGAGPAVGFPSASGVCLDVENKTVTNVASGAVGSIGGPLFDLVFLTILPNAFTGPEAPSGATCNDPPVLEIGGTGTRCLTAE
jgi:hypothetical protein